MHNQSVRHTRLANQQRQARGRLIFWGILATAILIGGGYAFLSANQGPMGEEFPVEPADHVAEGDDPGPYTTDPPTSGRHYAAEFDAGFYQIGDAATSVPYPAGYLVHNLEHGYVIFWYNCEALPSEASCSSLQAAIADVMEEAGNFKVIAFPWSTIDVPVVLTTWGRRLEMNAFDSDLAMEFVRRNRNEAPEPLAP